MKDYSTGEAQWLLDPEIAAKEQTNNGGGSNHHSALLQEDLEQECAPCRIFTTLLCMGVILVTIIGGVLYHSTILHWMKDHIPPITSSSSSSSSSIPPTTTTTTTINSRQEVANVALEALNANFDYYYHPTMELPLRPPASAAASESSSIHAHCQATVLLFRHCDDLGRYATDDNPKNDNDDDNDDDDGDYNANTMVDQHCSHMGYERASFLPTLFQRKWSSPDYLYAQLPPVSHKKHKKYKGINYRQIETLLPLSESFHIPIHIVQQPSEIGPHLMSQLLFGDDNMKCDSLTVVAWKHKYIPDVAAALGCGPEQGCSAKKYPDDTFDDIWELRFVYHPEEPNASQIADMFHQNSPLLQDDHGYLQEQLHMRNAAAAAAAAQEQNKEDDSDTTTPSPPLSPPPPPKVWTVYGTVTHQNFDPLEAQVATHRSRHPVEDDDAPPPQLLSSRFPEL